MGQKKVMNEVKHAITSATMEMETTDYVAFMKDLSNWCEDEANMQEYRNEFLEEDDESGY